METILDYVRFKDARNMAEVRTKSAQLVIISPPFVGLIKPEHSIIDKDKEKLLLEGIFAECARVVRDDGVVVSVNTDFRDDGMMYLRHMVVVEAALKAGLKPKDEKIWVRRFTRNLYRKTFSFILVFSKQRKILNKRLPNYEKDNWVLTQSQVVGNFRDAIAPEIPQVLVENFTDPGDLVVSACAGSGTIVIVANRLGRRAIGYEINPDMRKIIRLREKTIEQFYSPSFTPQNPAAVR